MYRTFVHLISVGFLVNYVQPSTFQSCAKTIINQLYTDTSYLVVSPHLDLDAEWNKWMPFRPYIVIDPAGTIFERQKQAKPKTYVIFVDHAEDYEDFLKAIYLTSIWNPAASFLVIDLGEIELIEVFELSFKYLALNVTVLSHNDVIYTYYPYNDGYCGDFRNFKEIIKCEDATKGGKLYYHPLPKTYNKCPIRVVVSYVVPYAMKNNTIRPEDPGIDLLILSETARRTNLELIYVEHNHTRSNGATTANYFSMYTDILDGRADMLIGGIIANMSYMKQFDSTKSYLSDTMVYYVPAAEPINEAEIFDRVFERKILFAMFLAFLLVAIVFYASSNLLGRPRGFESLFSSVWITLCISCCSARKYHELTKLRFLMFLWAVTFFALNTFFSSRLTSMFSDVPLGHDITTVEDIERYGMKYGGILYGRTSLEILGDERVPPLTNWELCDESFGCADRVVQKRDFAVFKSTRPMTYTILSRYTHKNGRRMLKALKEPKIGIHLWMVFKKGFPFRERFNQVLSMLSQSGLITKWSYYSTTEPPVKIGDNYRTINKEVMVSPARLLVVGYSTAFVVFLFELFLRGRSLKDLGGFYLRRARNFIIFLWKGN